MARTKKAVAPLDEGLFRDAPSAPPAAAAPSARKWTPAQVEAIRTTGTGLLVSAAAGSGKTSVLAERCAYLVCDAKPRCDVSQLLVVTFTEAAAAEMKSRIESTLRKRIAHGGLGDSHLRRQVKLIDHANVSTLHGFCSRVLRQHFHRVGLDPNFAILDGDESALLRADTVRQLFHDRYEADDAAFRAFVDAYGSGNDEPLTDLVLHTYELLNSVLDPAVWVARALAQLSEGAEQPFERSALGRAHVDTLREHLAGLQTRCRSNLHAMPADFPKFTEYLAALSDTLESWGATLRDHGYDALAAAAKDFAAPRLPTYPNTAPGKEAAALLVTSVRDDMTKGPLHDGVLFTSDEWRETLRVTIPHCSTFLNLVTTFGERYRDAKREARGLDFADLERLTLDLLRDPSSPRLSPSSTARTYHRQFAHVLVDEYQDINEVQDAILSLVSTECLAGGDSDVASNLFCVGDVKQSIYRFRLADPQRFLDRERAYRTPSTTNAGRVIDLSSNFRSRPALLETLNLIFQRLMTEGSAEIEYSEAHKLRPGASYPDDLPGTFRGTPLELHLLSEADAPSDEDATPGGEDSDLDRTEYEAHFVAHRLSQLLGMAGEPAANVIARKDDAMAPRPLRPGDCAILLRSPRHKAEVFAQALRLRNIPVHSDKGAGFFAAQEIQDVLALLGILDNQQQDVPLAAFLRSPLAALPNPEDALARVRLAYRDGDPFVPFHEAVVRYARERDDELSARLRDLLHQLDAWRTLARNRPLAELVWAIYDQTGYLAFCSGLEDGPQRVANLHHLHQRARQFGSFTRQGLYRFLRFLESLQAETDATTPSVSAASDDVVRIMSVHASKGLEFPVVVIPDLGKRHNLSDSKKGILVDRSGYVGLQVMDEPRDIKYPSLAHRLVRERIHRQSMAEELRLLYVALTRAKEHLILVGTCGDSANELWQRKWAGHPGPLPTDAFLASNTFLDWLGPLAHMLGQDAEHTIRIAQHTRAEILSLSNPESFRPKLTKEQTRLAHLQPLDYDPPQTEASRTVIRRLGYQYPATAFTKLPAALSATAWTKHGRPTPVRDPDSIRPITTTFAPTLPVPKCAGTGSPTTAATDRGTATHLALQHLDFSRPCTTDDLNEQLISLVGRSHLTAAQALLVEINALTWLLSTELGPLLRTHAKSLRRELPFYLSLAPGEVDPSLPSQPAAGPDHVMLRGRIDVLIPTGDSFTVIDYKTDAIDAGTVPSRSDLYRPQVSLYRRAVETMTGKPVSAAHLVYLTPRVVNRV